MSVFMRKRSVLCAGLSVKVLAMVLCLGLLTEPNACRCGKPTDILGIDVAPDLRRITVRADGPPAKPKAFVLPRPNRLVMDFESCKLGPVVGKIRVDREPIREIRLGSTDAKVRVVVDFGEHPVPPHTVNLEGNHVVVLLGRTKEGSGSVTRPPVKERTPKPASVAKPASPDMTKELRPKPVTVPKPVSTQVADEHRPVAPGKPVSAVAAKEHRPKPASVAKPASPDMTKELRPKPAAVPKPVPTQVADEHRPVAPGKPVSAVAPKEHRPKPASVAKPASPDMTKELKSKPAAVPKPVSTQVADEHRPVAPGKPVSAVAPKDHGPKSDEAAKSAAPETSNTSVKGETPQTHASGLAVREAGAAQDLVYLKLSDHKNPLRSYRVVLEVDPKRLRLVKGSMSDDRGKLNSFRFEAEGPEHSPAGQAPIEQGTETGSAQGSTKGPKAMAPPPNELPKGSASQPENSASEQDPIKVRVRKPPSTASLDKPL